MTAKPLLLISLLISLAVCQSVGSTSVQAAANIYLLPSVLPCVAYQDGSCVTCPYNYHINQNQCYLNITGCLTYQISNTGKEQCAECDGTSGKLDGKGGCSLLNNLQGFSTESISAEQIAATHGDNRFRIVGLQQGRLDPFFQICNQFMLNGQYKHFIRRSEQPVVSVAYFVAGNQNQYKILYNGSGGGLMMCIISIITTTNAVQINSFVPIGVTNIIDNCGQYDLQVNCVECLIGWHLQNGRCYVNIGGCVSYREEICMQCFGYSVLIENRCIGCAQIGDLNKLTYLRGVTQWVDSGRTPDRSQSYLFAGV